MLISDEDKDKLERSFSNASSNIKKQTSGKLGESYEKAYGIAYQQLVKSGLRPQIRKKYR